MRRVHRAAVVAALGLPLLLTMPGTAMAQHRHAHHKHVLNIIYQPIYILGDNDPDAAVAVSNTLNQNENQP